MELTSISVTSGVPTPSLMTSNVTDVPELNDIEAVYLFLSKYYIWIVFAVGFPGNLISLIVVVRMSRYKLTTSLMYVGLLAAVDNISIILKIINSMDLTMNKVGCKFLNFFGLTFVAYANWILVVISAERFTAVVFPLISKVFWSLKRAGILVGAVFLFLCFVHGHIFFTITAIDTKCNFHPKYQTFVESWWFPISSSVYAIIPAILIILFNVVIIVSMRRITSRRRWLQSKTDQSNSRPRQERQVTIMLVTLAIVFIVLTLPICIFLISYNYWNGDQNMWKNFTHILTSSIADTNHAVNFYLYLWMGKRFRRYCFNMFRCNLTKLINRCSRKNKSTSV